MKWIFVFHLVFIVNCWGTDFVVVRDFAGSSDQPNRTWVNYWMTKLDSVGPTLILTELELIHLGPNQNQDKILG